MIRHSNIVSGKYTLGNNKSLDEFIQELVESVFGDHSEVFDINQDENKITFQICGRKANYYCKIIDSIEKCGNSTEISYYVGANY